MTNNPNITNVLNPKSLEKQMKIYDSRLQILQAEVEELSRLRAACQLLLGSAPGAEAAAVPAEATDAKGPKGKKKEAKADDAAVPAEGEATPEVLADFDRDQNPPQLEN